MSTPSVPTNIGPVRFVARFAAGANGCALSSVWRVWAAKKRPDLYVAVRGMGDIKASVHCPRSDKPTWKRHFGFDFDGKGEISELVRASGESRHKMTWTGAPIGKGRTIEFRIFVRGPSLLRSPEKVADEISLVRPPGLDETLIFMIALGSPGVRADYPKPTNAEAILLHEGLLQDGRQVWISYCYTGLVTSPAPINQNPRMFGSKRKLLEARNNLRLLTPHPIEDGSLGLFEWRVELVGDDTGSVS